MTRRELRNPKWQPRKVTLKEFLAMEPASFLPDELVERIFGYVVDRGVASKLDVQQMMRVCKQWHKIGAPLYYKEVLIMTSYHPTGRYGWEYLGNPEYLNAIHRFHYQHVQSLTIECELNIPSTPSAFDLQHTIVAMANLKVFSLRVRSPNPDFQIDRRHLTKVVRALPLGIRSLEIDTLCSDRGSPESDLSRTIRGRLPYLTHLRLNLHYICGCLFWLPIICGRQLVWNNMRSLILARDDPLTRERRHPVDENGTTCCHHPTVSSTVIFDYIDRNMFPCLDEAVWYQSMCRSRQKEMGVLVVKSNGVYKAHRTYPHPRYIVGLAWPYPADRKSRRDTHAPIATKSSLYYAEDAGLHSEPLKVCTPSSNRFTTVADTRTTPEGDFRWRSCMQNGLRCPPGALCNIPTKWAAQPGLICTTRFTSS